MLFSKSLHWCIWQSFNLELVVFDREDWNTGNSSDSSFEVLIASSDDVAAMLRHTLHDAIISICSLKRWREMKQMVKIWAKVWIRTKHKVTTKRKTKQNKKEITKRKEMKWKDLVPCECKATSRIAGPLRSSARPWTEDQASQAQPSHNQWWWEHTSQASNPSYPMIMKGMIDKEGDGFRRRTWKEVEKNCFFFRSLLVIYLNYFKLVLNGKIDKVCIQNDMVWWSQVGVVFKEHCRGRGRDVPRLDGCGRCGGTWLKNNFEW